MNDECGMTNAESRNIHSAFHIPHSAFPMNIFENFRIALRALAANKLRSSLTMLGIIIGVGSVVALMAIGKGASADITSRVESIGSNLLTVSPGRLQFGPGGPQSGLQSFLYYSDYELLAAKLTNVASVVPVFQ